MIEISGIKACSLADIKPQGTNHYKPWTLQMLFDVEPDLQKIAQDAVLSNGKRFLVKHYAYVKAKDAAFDLVGWNAADPRLRSKGAWDCLFDYILSELNI